MNSANIQSEVSLQGEIKIKTRETLLVKLPSILYKPYISSSLPCDLQKVANIFQIPTYHSPLLSGNAFICIQKYI